MLSALNPGWSKYTLRPSNLRLECSWCVLPEYPIEHSPTSQLPALTSRRLLSYSSSFLRDDALHYTVVIIEAAPHPLLPLTSGLSPLGGVGLSQLEPSFNSCASWRGIFSIMLAQELALEKGCRMFEHFARFLPPPPLWAIFSLFSYQKSPKEGNFHMSRFDYLGLVLGCATIFHWHRFGLCQQRCFSCAVIGTCFRLTFTKKTDGKKNNLYTQRTDRSGHNRRQKPTINMTI